MMEDVPGWFVGFGGVVMMTMVSALARVLWNNMKDLKKDVDSLQKRMARAATLDDLQVISDRMREDNQSTQKRLDDILSKLSC